MTSPVSSRILLLNDPITQRIVLTWHLVGAEFRDAAAAPSDLYDAVARLAACEELEVGNRLPALLGLGLIDRDGAVAEEAGLYLERLARARWVGLGKEPGGDADGGSSDTGDGGDGMEN